ncbi:shufflon protein D', partial [Escherichia coli]
MLTSKEAKNNANNHSLQACQSGTWRKSNSGSTVITGRIANGQQIPLPTGFSASQCSWSVSKCRNPQ